MGNTIDIDIRGNLTKVKNMIKKEHPDLSVIRGEGYYYWTSEEDALAEFICSLYSSSIYVNSADHQSLDMWMKEADEVMAAFKKFEDEDYDYDYYKDDPTRLN